MKRIIIVFSLIVFLFWGSRVAEACGVNISPSSPVEGDTLSVSVLSLSARSYIIDVFFNTNTEVKRIDIPANSNPNQFFPISNTAEGSYKVDVRSPGISGSECSKTVPVAAPAGISSDALKTTPKSWLPGLNPGFGPSASQGIDFFKAKLIPFIISWAIFLVVFLSLVFLIIGGIMWVTSGGNKEGLGKAKGTVTYALVGLIAGAGSYVILRVIGQIFKVSLF